MTVRVRVDCALVAVFDGCGGEARVRCSTGEVSIIIGSLQSGRDSRRTSKNTYGPKSDGVAPPGSLGGGGRLMSVGPEILDMLKSSNVVDVCKYEWLEDRTGEAEKTNYGAGGICGHGK